MKKILIPILLFFVVFASGQTTKGLFENNKVYEYKLCVAIDDKDKEIVTDNIEIIAFKFDLKKVVLSYKNGTIKDFKYERYRSNKGGAGLKFANGLRLFNDEGFQQVFYFSIIEDRAILKFYFKDGKEIAYYSQI